MKPYLVVSDLHLHAWSTFASTNGDGINSRLAAQLADLQRAAASLQAAGGDTMVIAGDIFHTRGVIDPEVLNPARDCFRAIMNHDIHIHAIPGNHDLKSRDTRELSSAIENLSGIDSAFGSFTVYNKVDTIDIDGLKLGFVPWRERLDDLHADLAALAKRPGHDDADVFIHAGIDGVLTGMPAHGLTAADLAKYGFNRVFAGHYHNHRDMGSSVYSIGATAHQTWGDVGTRAGALLVRDDEVTFIDTSCPKFVDLTGLDEEEMEIECNGAFVRFRGPEMTQAEIAELRNQFEAWGAKGVSMQVPTKIVSHRTTAPATGKTLDQTVADHIAAMSLPGSLDAAAVQKRALEVLTDVRSVTE